MAEPGRAPDDDGDLGTRFPALRKVGPGGRGRRIPFVQQLAATECGAACLAMVLGYFGKNVRLDEVREICGADRDGVSALTILNAANLLGLRGRGVKLEMDALDFLEPASVLHWNFEHFVVFEKLRKDSVDIIDPAFGRRRVPMEEFRKAFTGVCVLLEPSEMFEPEAKQKSRLWSTAKEVLGRSGLLPRVVVTSMLLQLFALGVPLLTGQLVDKVVPRGDVHLLTVLMVGLGGMVAFQFLATLIRGHLLLHLRTYLDARMTLGFIEHLVNLPYAFFQLRSAGDLMMRLNSNTTVREVLTSGALSGILDGILVLLYLAILLAVSPAMGVLVLGIGGLTILIFVVARRRQRELAAQNLQTEAKSQSYQVEMLTGMATLKAMGSEMRAVDHWSNLFVDVLNVSLQRGRLNASIDAVTGALKLGAPLVILAVGALEVLHGQMSLGTMLSFTALAGSFLGPLSNLVATAMQLQLLQSYLDRINDVLDTPLEQDRKQVRRTHRLSGQIAIERVSFRYGPLAPFVVEDVSLEVAPGMSVAIVGKSGAGKSTLASLLLGLYVPTSGRILFDGVDLTELDLRALRQQLGIVTQQQDLFGASIRENIALADPSLPLAQVIQAAKRAGIHDEIMAMPLGYQTPLVDRGASISGGQRQRLMLARAFVRKPAILLLDEATSALDSVTESRVQAALSELRCTRIIIAHRLSTVVNADLIVVMDDGRIVESGSHDELLELGGFYEKLISAQSGKSAS